MKRCCYEYFEEKEEKDEIKKRLARGDGKITANMEMTTREQY